MPFQAKIVGKVARIEGLPKKDKSGIWAYGVELECPGSTLRVCVRSVVESEVRAKCCPVGQQALVICDLTVFKGQIGLDLVSMRPVTREEWNDFSYDGRVPGDAVGVAPVVAAVKK